MDPEIAQQLGIGALVLAVGASGWLLPFEWNLLRLRRLLGHLVPEHINRAVPKVVGTILIVAGLAILVGTAVLGKFK
jgi:hypothetical protein